VTSGGASKIFLGSLSLAIFYGPLINYGVIRPLRRHIVAASRTAEETNFNYQYRVLSPPLHNKQSVSVSEMTYTVSSGTLNSTIPYRSPLRCRMLLSLTADYTDRLLEDRPSTLSVCVDNRPSNHRPSDVVPRPVCLCLYGVRARKLYGDDKDPADSHGNPASFARLTD